MESKAMNNKQCTMHNLENVEKVLKRMNDETLYTLADIKDYFRWCMGNPTGSARKRFEKYISAVDEAMTWYDIIRAQAERIRELEAEKENTSSVACGDTFPSEGKARLMTLEEVLNAQEGVVVWVEQHTDEKDYISAMVCSGEGAIGNFYLGLASADVAGKNLRYWSARPTDEQREAVKWDE